MKNPDTSKAPDWLLKQHRITQRQWKSRKRSDLKRLDSAFHNYRIGCAYCPAKNGEVGIIEKLLNEMKESHSLKMWGR